MSTTPNQNWLNNHPPVGSGKPYETPWPFTQLPAIGERVKIGSNAEATVIRINEKGIFLDNGRWFKR